MPFNVTNVISNAENIILICCVLLNMIIIIIIIYLTTKSVIRLLIFHVFFLLEFSVDPCNVTIYCILNRAVTQGHIAQ